MRESRHGWSLSNAQFDEALRRLRAWKVNHKACPVCDFVEVDIPPDGNTLPTDHDCVKARSLQRDQAAAGLSPRFLNFDWSGAQSTPVTRAVDRYIADFDENVAGGNGLVFLADNYGSGKTQGLVRILTHALEQGYTGREARLVLFKEIIGSYQLPEPLAFEHEMERADLIAIDEVVPPTSEAQATLFERFAQVVDARYVAMRPTFLAGNLTAEKLGQCYSKVFSRLHSTGPTSVAAISARADGCTVGVWRSS
jgi:DNA replication protein DnaC